MSTSPSIEASNPGMATNPTIKNRNPRIADFNFRSGLPTASELPDSDDKPVDSELQELIPGLLKAILFYLRSNRTDWLFGIDMGLYAKPSD
jgi:hypothetical protein